MVITGTCCSGDQCPIHGNHHHSQKADDAPMECGHGEHNMSTMDNCSMSRYHNTEQAAVHAHLFLPTPLGVSTSLAPYSAISSSSALADGRYLLDNSNTFGGTHWNYPRQVSGEIRYRFHF